MGLKWAISTHHTDGFKNHTRASRINLQFHAEVSCWHKVPRLNCGLSNHPLPSTEFIQHELHDQMTLFEVEGMCTEAVVCSMHLRVKILSAVRY
jgi:hypothetical protein